MKLFAIGRNNRFRLGRWSGPDEVALLERWGLREAAGERRPVVCLPNSIPSHARSLLWAYPAPCGSALFCFRFAALWVTVSTFGGPSVNAELGAWEPGPLAWLRPV
jgi:hypothetical protein